MGDGTGATSQSAAVNSRRLPVEATVPVMWFGRLERTSEEHACRIQEAVHQVVIQGYGQALAQLPFGTHPHDGLLLGGLRDVDMTFRADLPDANELTFNEPAFKEPSFKDAGIRRHFS